MADAGAATPFIPPNIELLTAPQLLGIMFNWGLFGILTVQVFLYHLCFNDYMGLKILVYGLYFLECIQTALSSAEIFHWFAHGWGRIEALTETYTNPISLPLMAGLISLIVQLYFTWRIWILGRSMVLTIIIAAVSIAQAAAGFAAGIMALQVGNLQSLATLVAPKIWLAGAALSDTLIALAMTYFLYRAKRRSSIQKTNYILTRIIALTLETNALSGESSVAIITLALFISHPENTMFLCPPYALGKLYSNTLLTIFNNRMIMPYDRSQHPSIGLTSAMNGAGSHSDNGPRNKDEGIRVNVLRETDTNSHEHMGNKFISLDAERQ